MRAEQDTPTTLAGGMEKLKLFLASRPCPMQMNHITIFLTKPVRKGAVLAHIAIVACFIVPLPLLTAGEKRLSKEQ